AQASKRQLLRVMSLCGFFFLLELAGGYLSGSLAIFSDSFHLLSVRENHVPGIISPYLSLPSPLPAYTFGYHRAEVVGVLFSIFLLWLLTALLVREAWDRLWNPRVVDGMTMLVIASLGLGVNLILALFLHPPHHHHHHHHHSAEEGDHEQGPSLEEGTAHAHSMNINVKAALIHVIGDLCFSLGILISSIVIVVDPTKTFIDPLCTFIFSAIVIATTIGLVRDAVHVLMEASPRGMNVSMVEEAMGKVSGVIGIHSLHIWSLTMNKAALMAHVEAQGGEGGDRILSEMSDLLDVQFGIRHVTLQLE
ncbi:cation efflux protein, partial [Piptocephalis cylindrospora]